MNPTVKNVGDNIQFGEDLTSQQLNALKSASPTGDDILENLENLNEEINDLSEGTLPKVNVPRSRKKRPNQSTKKSTKKSGRNMRTESKRNIQVQQNDDLDLDMELEQAEKELEQQNQTIGGSTAQQNVTQDSMKSQIMDALNNLVNAPSEKQIQAWKAQRGKNSVYVMAFSESDVYIYTYLTRGQHQKIQELVKKASETGNINLENHLKEKVIQYCVLWPKPLPVEFFYNSRAGVVDGLYEAIMIQSGFLSPQQLMLLTTQL